MNEQIDMKQYPEGAPRWAVHRIEIDLVAADGFAGTVVKEIGGNAKGGDLLTMIDELESDFEPDMSIDLNAKHCRVSTEEGSEGYIELYVLYNEQGESRAIGYDRIKPHIVGVRIAACWPEAKQY